LVDVSSLGVIARDEWVAALFFVHSQHRAANGIPVEIKASISLPNDEVKSVVYNARPASA
jgi:hypothetical protein